MQLQLNDHVALDNSSDVRMTQDGYLVAMPRVARTGIQLYKGAEVGMPQMDTVRVYRPPEEVFDRASTHTYAFRPVTDNHPPKPVTSDNWKDFAIGNIGEGVMRDGEFLRVPMLLMDKKTIEKVADGKSELSVGYTTELKWQKGTVPGTNESYDAIQTAIRVNHVAIVDSARGGPKLKIGDMSAPDPSNRDAGAGHEGETDMTDSAKKTTTVMVDGIACQMEDTYAAIVQKTLGDLNAKLQSTTAQVTTLTQDAAKAKSEHDAAVAKLTTEHKTALDAAKAEIETLKKQVADAALTPEKLETLVKDRSAMLHKATAILGDKLVTKDKTDAEIRRQVVDAQMGEAAKGWTDEQVKVSFDTITAKVKAPAAPGVTDMASAFSQPPRYIAGTPASQEQKDQMYRKADEKLSNAWKGQAA